MLADVHLAVTTEISSLSQRKVICIIFRNMLSSLFHKQISGGKLVTWPETDVGSEQLLASFSVTHPGLAAVTVDMF